jgi:hypothetical protein
MQQTTGQINDLEIFESNETFKKPKAIRQRYQRAEPKGNCQVTWANLIDDIRRDNAAARQQATYLSAVEDLERSVSQKRLDKQILLERYLHQAAEIAGLQAHIEALRDALRELDPSHPMLLTAVDSVICEPARQETYANFAPRTDQLTAWLER